MKKATKLTLSTETLRTLSTGAIDRVRGGNQSADGTESFWCYQTNFVGRCNPSMFAGRCPSQPPTAECTQG